MSLLMDALKKAEQEKREASKKLLSSDDTIQKDIDPEQTREDVSAEATGEMTTGESAAEKTYQTSAMDLSLTPIEARTPVEESSETEDVSEATEKVVPVDDFSEEPTLNVTRDELSLTEKIAQNVPEADSAEDDTLETRSNPTEAGGEPDLDQTFHGLDLDQTNTSELYEDTIQGEAFKPEEIARSYDETLPGVPAAQLARDIGTRDQPTPVAAQTVFSATQTVARPSSGLRWLLISLCVLAVGSAVVFYYFSVTPVNRDIPSPMVARGVESVIRTEDIQPVVPPDIASVTESMDISGATDPATALEETESGLIEGTISAPVEADTPADEAVVGGSTDESSEDIAAESEPEPAPVPEPRVADTLPQVLEAPASMIRISRSARVSGEGQLVNDAFSAYQQGDYALAKSRYEQAYKQSPASRDVLLGLAATAVKTGDNDRALQIYSQLLRMNPQDNLARAAVLAWQRGENIPGSISLIKTMLHDASDQPALHFSLGKLYAAQARWAEAQQAFFDAYRLDTVNPDYAFNLAVSLDRMGQAVSALDYYNVALELSADTRAGFDPTAVTRRIRTIESRE